MMTMETVSPKRHEGHTDRDLLAQYIATGSECAFAEIVTRYSGMVYSNCLRILGDAQGAEDASQVTFIVLTKRATTISAKSAAVGGWLCRTSLLVARDAAKMRQKRRQREMKAMMMQSKTIEHPIRPAEWAELRLVLDEALVSLPVEQQDAIVLRYFRGISDAAAAQELGCPPQTFNSRVQLGLAKLRAKLQKNKITLPMLLLTTLLRENFIHDAPTEVTASIIKTCSRNAILPAATMTAVQSACKTFLWMKVGMWVATGALAAATYVAAVAIEQHWAGPSTQTIRSNQQPPETHVVSNEIGKSAQPATVAPGIVQSQRNNAEANDGERLNDGSIWEIRGDIPLPNTITSTRIEVDPTISKGVFALNHLRTVNLHKHTSLVRLTANFPGAPSKFQFAITMYTWTRENESFEALKGENHCVDLLFDQASSSVLDASGKPVLVNPHIYLGTRLNMQEKNKKVLRAIRKDLITPTTFAPGRHTIELAISSSDILATVDGVSLYKGPNHFADTYAWVGIRVQAAKENPVGGMVSIENVYVGESSELKADHPIPETAKPKDDVKSAIPTGDF